MLNIKSLLNTQIKEAFNKYYNMDINDKLITILNYNGNYSLKSLPGLFKCLKSNNIDITSNKLCEQLTENINRDLFDVTINKNSIDVSIKNAYIIESIKNIFKCGIINKAVNKKRILVDFSSPNIAKEMHVGHLRSTIIGDSICKLYEMEGHEVHRINHIGDFGLQFGMIIQYILELYPDYKEYEFSNQELQNFYVNSKKKFDTDEKFKMNAYKKVVLLQSGDEEASNVYHFVKSISMKSYNEIYNKLNIINEEVGESFYQNMIPGLIRELDEKGILMNDGERKVIKVNGYELMLTVMKSDGGFTYDTTDLAAIRYRLVELSMDKVIYVVDNGQELHFKLIFAVARMAGWINEGQEVEHVGFGVVTGEDGKRLKTREGNAVKLSELLDQSLIKADEVLKEKNEKKKNKISYSEDEEKLVIETVAYGCLKYADLATVRTNDYKFSYTRMLSVTGNTAVYQLYAYVKICSIIRNSGVSESDIVDKIEEFTVSEKEEVDVCKMILLFPEIMERVNANLMFNTLCTYLYDLANLFHVFHKKCRCLIYNKEGMLIDRDYSKLLICISTKYILEHCFNILGINKLEKM